MGSTVATVMTLYLTKINRVWMGDLILTVNIGLWMGDLSLMESRVVNGGLEFDNPLLKGRSKVSWAILGGSSDHSIPDLIGVDKGYCYGDICREYDTWNVTYRVTLMKQYQVYKLDGRSAYHSSLLLR